MSVGEYCNREVIITDRHTSIVDAAKLMRQHHVGDLVVVQEVEGENVPIGIITDRDIVIEMLAKEIPLNSVTVVDLMTRELATVREDADLWDTLAQMRSLGLRRMPVINSRGGLSGILTTDDALELLTEGLTDVVRLVRHQKEVEEAHRP